MRKLGGIIRYTVLEVFRNKVYYVLLLFGVVLIGSTLLLGSLGGEQRARMIIDMGLVSIEAFALIVAVFGAVTLVLEEMESRTLYLILTRPVGRFTFILGRFLGLLVVLTLAYLLMAGAHAALCAAVHVPLDWRYVVSLFASWEKIALITAVAVVFSLFATSTVSAVMFTLFFWVMGHFSSELAFLADRSHQPVVLIVYRLFYFVAPNFELLNIRDFPPNSPIPWASPSILYALTYIATALLAANLLFRRKEF